MLAAGHAASGSRRAKTARSFFGPQRGCCRRSASTAVRIVGGHRPPVTVRRPRPLRQPVLGIRHVPGHPLVHRLPTRRHTAPPAPSSSTPAQPIRNQGHPLIHRTGLHPGHPPGHPPDCPSHLSPMYPVYSVTDLSGSDRPTPTAHRLLPTAYCPGRRGLRPTADGQAPPAHRLHTPPPPTAYGLRPTTYDRTQITVALCPPTPRHWCTRARSCTRAAPRSCRTRETPRAGGDERGDAVRPAAVPHRVVVRTPSSDQRASGSGSDISRKARQPSMRSGAAAAIASPAAVTCTSRPHASPGVQPCSFR